MWLMAFAWLWVWVLLGLRPALAQPSPAPVGSAGAPTGPEATPSGAPEARPTQLDLEPVPTPSDPAAAPAASPKPKAPLAPGRPTPPRATPRETVAGFLRATEQGDLETASAFLDLRGMRWGQLTPERAADELAAVIAKRLVVRLDVLSDVPEGRPEDGENVERLGSVDVAGEPVGITLSRSTGPTGQPIWLFSQETVARIPDMHLAISQPGTFVEELPPSLRAPTYLGLLVWQWLGIAFAGLVAYPLGFLLGSAVVWLLRKVTARTDAAWDDAVVERGRGPFRFTCGWLVLGAVIGELDFPAAFIESYRVLYTIPLILATGWFLIRAVNAVTSVLGDPHPEDTDAEHASRGLRTQLVMLRKLLKILIGFVTFSVVLLQFEVVQSVGLSLLASAGVAGVALGFAAQRSLGAVIAGIQLSITQPIRIGDAVVVKDQWGEVEEITLTYVRLKLWDERRLVVPIDVFLTTVFENWSKPGTELIGVIEIAVDPTTPIPALREKFEELAKAHPRFDGRECLLQVIDLNERRALVRARASTSDPDECFAMRCDLREQMMRFLQSWDGGRYLPRHRLEVTGLGSGGE